MTVQPPSPSPSRERPESSSQPHPQPPSPPPAPRRIYRNNLLLLVGYLDLANSLDFPANVWNQRPPPLFAKVLMGLGGSIMLLFISVAVIDFRRSLANTRLLRDERRVLRSALSELDEKERGRRRVLKAWLGVNRRELGWENFDRIGLDVAMGVSGVIVGIGTLLAIRGDKKVIYHASNLMSGYVGNSFMPAFAAVNTAWSGYMFLAGRRHAQALNDAGRGIDPATRRKMMGQARRHQLYAAMMVCSTWVTAVGSMMSATMWQGYVVLIPSIVGSIWCNWFWRKELGYNRRLFQDWDVDGRFDILERFRIAAAEGQKRVSAPGTERMVHRFLAELYGFWLCAAPAEKLKLELEKVEEPERLELDTTPPGTLTEPKMSMEMRSSVELRTIER